MQEETTSLGPIESELSGASPHISDYWHVMTRRLWLVLLIFGVTTASAIWAVSKQRTIYETGATLQINDPLEVTRQLTVPTRVSGMNIFVDPIESEIQVLASVQVARSVVNRLGMRLVPENPNLVRSDLFVDTWIAPEADDGVLDLVYDEQGTAAQIFDGIGNLVLEGPVGMDLDGGWLRLKLQLPPEESRRYRLVIHPVTAVQGEVQGRLVAAALQSTNIIRVSYRNADPILAPQILNGATVALQGFGEDRVRVQAERDLRFIEQRLDSALSQLQGSSRAIRSFKESARFTSLSATAPNQGATELMAVLPASIVTSGPDDRMRRT